ncbi:MAG: (Fe-S)-cluster assembly protein [Roseiflexaceae bacterium]
MRDELLAIYGNLAEHYAHEPHWWPIQTDDPPFEVIVGMVLVQQTRWQAVEAAIGRLIAHGWMSPQAIAAADTNELALLIRPCAFQSQKALGLQAICQHLLKRYAGSAMQLLDQESQALRNELLSLPRVGNETADTIMLYGGGHPVFIVDAYARRILARVRLPTGSTAIDFLRAPYDRVRLLVEEAIASGPPPLLSPERQQLPAFIRPRSPLTAFYWDLHALLVEACIHHCQATRIRCHQPGLQLRFVDSRKCGQHCRSCTACPLATICTTAA